MCNPGFPPEITDHIIALNVGDAKTLCSCALVCQAWLPASRSALFESMKIPSHRAYELLVDRVLVSDYLQRYLNTTLEMRIDIDKPRDDDDDTPYAPVLLPFLLSFYGRISNLRHLTLVGTNITVIIPHHTNRLLLAQFPHLTTLSLSRCRFFSFNDLRRTLSAIPALEHLQIEYISCANYGRPWFQLPGRSRIPSLLTFQVRMARRRLTDDHVSGNLMQWFAATSLPSRLTDLNFQTVTVVASPFREGYIAFFNWARHSVTSITLNIMRHDHPLPYFHNLVDITFRVVPLLSEWSRVCSMLRDLRSRPRRLRFLDLQGHGPCDPVHSDGCLCLMKESGVSSLDDVLSSDAFDNLNEVHFRLRRRYFPDDILNIEKQVDPTVATTHLQDILPKLLARGIMTLSEEKFFVSVDIAMEIASELHIDL
ncbi:hypothetical protein L226DRAFT_155178 [Lentinus tigrinus ALCF2SS1-7]|uniref:uncharacterized protein n=1 Tax=Lentinus tigrinus ALCF2SS1-7 TaxID=1328758 RepID=UPI00116634A2|nr:hypothetical protein L226DRAFT_155178 [Lentinus tigrinus ALCF2SS1-7]